MPEVTVAIPLYNAEATIARTLGSVLGQTFADYEIVVVDDGSTDAGATVVAATGDPRLRLVRQANGGVAAARNRALQEARGRLVAFLDADDLWRPRHLEHLVALAGKFPTAGLLGNGFVAVSPGHVAIQPDSDAEATQDVSLSMLPDYFAAWARGEAPFHTSSSMVRREVALRAGGFPAGHSRGEDLVFFIRMAIEAPVAVSDYIGCYYVRQPVSLTSAPVLEPDIAMQTIATLLAKPPAGMSEQSRIALGEYYNKIAIANALDCILHARSAEARRFLDLSASTVWQRRRWWLARLSCIYPPALHAVMALMRLANAQTGRLR